MKAHLASALFCLAVAARAAGPLLFHASLERSATADFASGDPEPLVADGVQVMEGARFPPGARLTYDARANLYAEQGTVSFWWRPDEPPGRLSFPLFVVSYEQHSTWDFNFARISWSGSDLTARITDRNLESRSVRAAVKPEAGRWVHIAMSWSEADGLALYVDGKPGGRAPGPLALDARLDQFGFLTKAVTPHHTAGNENPGSIREARIYRAPLSAAEIARLAAGQEPVEARRAEADFTARFGWSEAARVPVASTLAVKRIGIVEAKDLGKFWLKGADGKRETLWPMVSHGYTDEGKTYRVRPAPEPVNLLRTSGNLAAHVALSNGSSYERSAAGELHYHALAEPAALESIVFERRSGALGDLECLLAEEKTGPEGEAWMSFAPAESDEFRERRDPETFTAWKPSSEPGTGPGRPRYHYFRIPVEAGTALDAVRLRLDAAPGAYYYAAVRDPINTARELIEMDVRAAGERLDLTLDFPDVVVPAGKQIIITLVGSDPAPPRLEALLIPADRAAAREQHVTERILHLRDSFQMLSEARPWMSLSSRLTLATLRRQLKLIDELYTLMEDIRRLDPAQPVANAYWSWINRSEPPPPFEETPPSDPAVPLWAHRQLTLLGQFRQVADWWIDNRQIETGEMGGGLGDDTDMVQNWPGVALLDGPAEKIKRSVRQVLEACYAHNMIVNGMNRSRTDALHAYEEGMNAYGPAFLLDYGNPVLLERMLETASHYGRLTGINAAGHRHFRSYQYSATDLVEEGYHAREDTYSHLILHPGLYVAWYNGLPAASDLLKEFADSLLAHWTAESYPSLAKAIFFADDRVEGRSAPNTETYNLMWGLFDVTRDAKYLWLLGEAVKARDFSRAGSVNGPWLDQFPGILDALNGEVRRRNIHDHNLQTDQAGLVARVLAWQAGGDVKLIEDAHAALVLHMAQNMYLYTEAEQFTDRIWIPTLSVQRERLGGVAHYRNHIYPGHAVSWEETGGEVAALVPAARPDSLRLILFNAGPQARRVRARVWQLENGVYEVSVRDEDGAALPVRSLRLKRHSPVELELPSKKTVTVEFRQIERGVPLSELPDLALAAEEMRGENELEVPVHNIGAVESGPYTVTVRDAEGRLLAESHQPALDAPLDLKARIATVRFPGIAPRPGLRISVKQDGGAEEICDENNEAVPGGR